MVLLIVVLLKVSFLRLAWTAYMHSLMSLIVNFHAPTSTIVSCLSLLFVLFSDFSLHNATLLRLFLDSINHLLGSLFMELLRIPIVLFSSSIAYLTKRLLFLSEIMVDSRHGCKILAACRRT